MSYAVVAARVVQLLVREWCSCCISGAVVAA